MSSGICPSSLLRCKKFHCRSCLKRNNGLNDWFNKTLSQKPTSVPIKTAKITRLFVKNGLHLPSCFVFARSSSVYKNGWLFHSCLLCPLIPSKKTFNKTRAINNANLKSILKWVIFIKFGGLYSGQKLKSLPANITYSYQFVVLAKRESRLFNWIFPGDHRILSCLKTIHTNSNCLVLRSNHKLNTCEVWLVKIACFSGYCMQPTLIGSFVNKPRLPFHTPLHSTDTLKSLWFNKWLQVVFLTSAFSISRIYVSNLISNLLHNTMNQLENVPLFASFYPQPSTKNSSRSFSLTKHERQFVTPFNGWRVFVGLPRWFGRVEGEARIE